MDGKPPAVFIICFVAQEVEQLCVENTHDKVKGVVGVADNHEKGGLSVTYGVKLHFVGFHTLIARPEYIGKTVNFRTFKNSYKDKKTKRADKEDWVVFDDTQEPIVDEETWLLAQKLRQNVRKADPIHKDDQAHRRNAAKIHSLHAFTNQKAVG